MLPAFCIFTAKALLFESTCFKYNLAASAVGSAGVAFVSNSKKAPLAVELVRIIPPVPFPEIFNPILVSPLAANSGGFPVAAFVIAISLTALPVVWKMTCSLPFASATKPALAILGAVNVLLVRVCVADKVTTSTPPTVLEPDTTREPKVPTEVIFVWAAVVKVPTIFPKVAFITVPENTSELFVAVVKPVNTPAESSYPKNPTLAALS